MTISPSPPLRHLRLTLPGPTEPWFTHDNIRDLWYSTSQAFGKVSDVVGLGSEWDQYPGLRVVQMVGLVWGNLAATFYSHEAGHLLLRLNRGIDPQARIDWDNWWRGFPDIDREPIEDVFPEATVQDKIAEKMGGLNQDEFNATFLHRRMVRGGQLTFDEGLAYFFTAPADLFYQAFELAPHPEVYLKKNGDTSKYRELLEENGIELTGLKYGLLSGITAGLSLPPSIYAMGAYFASGRRRIEFPSLVFEGGVAVYYPHFALLAHQQGPWVGMELPVKLEEGRTLFLYAGTGALSELDRFRVGAEYMAAGPFTRLSFRVIPSLYVTLPRDKPQSASADEVGLHAGLKLRLPLAVNQAYVEFGGQVSHKDVIENEIKARTDDTIYLFSVSVGTVY